MKKSLTKLIVSCTAVTAVAAAMAISASAATNYDSGATQFTNTNAVPAEAGKQATILVQAKTDSALTEGDIYYIDQEEASAAATKWATIKFAAALDDGDYVIKMGGEGVATIATEDVHVGTPVGPTYTLGDVDNNGDIDTVDALAVVNHFLEKVILTDEGALAAAEITGDGDIDTLDALEIVNYFLEKDNLIDGSKK